LTFAQLVSLSPLLTRSANKKLIEDNERELMNLPITGWEARINAVQSASLIKNVGSVEDCLSTLEDLYG
jgi:hypothetical protein